MNNIATFRAIDLYTRVQAAAKELEKLNQQLKLTVESLPESEKPVFKRVVGEGRYI